MGDTTPSAGTPTWVIALVAALVALVALPLLAGVAIVALGVVAAAGLFVTNQQAVYDSRRAVVQMGDGWDACLNALGAVLDPSYARYWIQPDAGRLAVHAVVDLDQDGTTTHLATDAAGDLQVLDGAW